MILSIAITQGKMREYFFYNLVKHHEFTNDCIATLHPNSNGQSTQQISNHLLGHCLYWLNVCA
ncbi:MAG TPA: hypothetical protein VM532_11820, partial [Burkholderiales bacterium]|nr:hypothetical protein [Burkholderiales bacterium]